jgi:hypothetical protein
VLSLELEKISAADAGCTRIRQIPGIGPIVATAIVAAIDNGAAFHKVRVCRTTRWTHSRPECLATSLSSLFGQQACTNRVGRVVERRRLSPYTDDDVTSAEKTPTAWKRRRSSIIPHYDHG